MQEAHGPQQWTVPQGYFGPLAMIALAYNEYLHRYGATREAMAAVVDRGPQEWSQDPVVLLVRATAHRRGVHSGTDDQRPDLPVRL